MILWTNAIFYTMEDQFSKVNKVLTNNGLIVALGSDTNKYTPKKVIDLKGYYAFPGFTESHIHLVGYGRKLFANNLLLEKDKNIVLKKIKNLYMNNDLRIEGYFNIGITREELDQISKDHYIILRHNDYHSFTVNSKVLNELGLKGNGIILEEKIAKLIIPFWENSSKENLYKMTNHAINKLKSLGFTNVHTDDLSYFNSYLETLEILNELSQDNIFRINTLINYKILNDYKDYYIKDNKYLNAIQIKLFYDGTLSSKTAYLKENYYNNNTKGKPEIELATLIKLLNEARKLNKGLAIHTIGDQALEDVVTLLRKYPKSIELDRIVHASLCPINLNLKDIPIDIQPLFKISDQELIKNNIVHKPLIYPFDKYNSETIINSSSDAPVEDPNPLLSIYHLNEISRFDAIKSYTVNPYLTINKKGGLLKEGYLADFTIFDKDILKIEQEELLKTKVKYTIIDENINSY